MSSSSKSDRVKRHVNAALATHLRPDDVIESAHLDAGSLVAGLPFRISKLLKLRPLQCLVVTDRRLIVLELDRPFPAKADASVGPVRIVDSRARQNDDELDFPTTWSDLEEPNPDAGRMQVSVQVNRVDFSPGRGWRFQPAS